MQKGEKMLDVRYCFKCKQDRVVEILHHHEKRTTTSTCQECGQVHTHELEVSHVEVVG